MIWMLILRGTDGMNPQKGNCWMKDYEHRVSVLRPGPLSAPQKLTHYAGTTLKGPAQNSLQSAQLCRWASRYWSSQFRKQMCPQVLMLKGSSNLPKADGLVRGTAGSHPGLSLKPTCFMIRSPAFLKWGSCYPPPLIMSLFPYNL